MSSGLGRYFAVDPTLVRVGFAVATIFTGGVAALAYLVMWFLMPEEPTGAPAWPHPAGTSPGWPPVPPAGPPAAGAPTHPGPAPQAGPMPQAGPTFQAGPAPQATPQAGPVPQDVATTPQPGPAPQATPAAEDEPAAQPPTPPAA